ncbi:MAG: PACE efflux transporter [Burkholderiaceae bacterium]
MQGLQRKIVYVTLFEAFAIALCTLLLKLMSGAPALSTGAAAVSASMTAMAWNYVYNTLFEAWEARQARKGRSILRRICHAVGFEAGLIVVLVPLFAWLLGTSLMEALMLNLAMIVFFLVYAFLFNLAFDKLFGLPASAQGL